MTGVGLAQVLNIGAYPILTRLYGPEDFGLLAVLTSFCMPISVAAAFGYEPAVVLPEKREEAASLLSLNCLLIALTVTACFLILFSARFYSGDLGQCSRILRSRVVAFARSSIGGFEPDLGFLVVPAREIRTHGRFQGRGSRSGSRSQDRLGHRLS